MTNRSNVISLIAGTRDTGKTNFTKEISKLSPLPKKLIIDTIDSPPWRTMKTYQNPDGEGISIPVLKNEDEFKAFESGYARMFSPDTEMMFQLIECHLRNTLLIIEDGSKFIGKQLSRSFKGFMYDSKQKNLDIIIVFHNLAAIPPELVRIADTLTLFKTNDGTPSPTKYPFPELIPAMQHVRKSTNRYENVTLRLN